MKLNYKVLGTGDPLIILHGFLGTLDNWVSIGNILADHFKVYLVDQRNHGRSAHTNEMSYDCMTSDLRELIIDEQISSPILLGHSMGGKVVMNYARSYPEEFKMLIAVDIAPKAYPIRHQFILDGLFSVPLKDIKSRNEADQVLSKSIPNYNIRQFLLKNLTRTKNGFEWKINLPVLNNYIAELGEEIFKENLSSKPVYFIRGDKSDYILREDRDQIKLMFPAAIILSIKDAGHWVHAEQMESFVKTILQITTKPQ